ncbi:MAG: efflux RND transporter periplasmic adaptor subunit [Bacteroidetes bacterium]|nr:efflux RND transporter periplasmic adaptor subunit [Bacteroidota bacterium]
MKSLVSLTSLLILILGIFSCTSDSIEAKKAELESLKSQVTDLNAKIKTLEEELIAADPEFAAANKKSLLITTLPARKGTFTHYLEVTGSVLSKKNVTISSETVGRILEIPAQEGMRVTRGQILARIDSESLQRSVEELENSLALARTVFEKQERLWNQKIGTEVQYLESKNRKEGLEKSLASLKAQLAKSLIRAPFAGTIESVQVRLGELMQPGLPMFQFVGESDLFIEADLSENYINAIAKGDSVQISFPSINKNIASKVSATGAIINPNNRTFKVEVALPNLSEAKPNMLSVLKIKDYTNAESVVVPGHLILSDTKGDYVFAVENGVAKKKYVKRGYSSGEETEILEGLVGTEILVDKGFREVIDNFSVNVAKQ